jgi:hypothetical protein
LAATTKQEQREQAYRDWNWDSDGELEGLYVETRVVNIAAGPSAGTTKLVFDFHVGLEEELVTAWETDVLKKKLREELQRRGKPDFEPGERFKIRPKGMKQSRDGQRSYRDFEVAFEHAAPKPSTAELLAAGAEEDEATPEQSGDDNVPF